MTAETANNRSAADLAIRCAGHEETTITTRRRRRPTNICPQPAIKTNLTQLFNYSNSNRNFYVLLSVCV